MFRTAIAATALAALALAAAPVRAQDTGPGADAEADAGGLRLELNKADDTAAGACRLTYVASNQSDVPLDRTAYEVAVFDADGVVKRLLVLEFGALIEGKTKILQFDLAGTPCDGISRIVVNDAAGCVASEDGGDVGLCMAGLETASLTAIRFGI